MSDDNEVRTSSHWEDLPPEFHTVLLERGFRREDWEQQSLVWRETYVTFAWRISHDTYKNR